MRQHVIHADAVEILAGGGKADRVGYVGGACLELVRQHVPGGVVVANELDHVAPELIGGHRFEDTTATDETADPHGTAHLVAAERVEVHVERVEGHAKMRCALRAITDDERTDAPSDGSDLGDGIDRSDGVGHVIEGDDSRARSHECAQRIQVHALLAGERADDQPRAARKRELLPGDEVGVVLERGDDDLVAGLHVRWSPRGRDEVDGFGGTASEDETVRVGDAEEASNALPGGMIALRGTRGEVVGAAMRVGVVTLVVVAHRVEDDAGLL